MSETADHEHVVLAESGRAYWVCVRRPSKPGWLQVVAGFMDRDRAEQYAEFEDMTLAVEEELRPDIAEAPKDTLPPSRLAEVLRPAQLSDAERADRAQALADAREAEREAEADEAYASAPEEPRSGVELSGKIPELIVRLLPFFTEKRAGGPTIKDVVAHCRLPEAEVRQAFNEIGRRNLAVVWQERAGAPLQVAPLGFEAPTKPALSPNQEAVLTYLSDLPTQDETGIVSPPSLQKMHEQTGVPKGSLGAAVSDLERKGKIEAVSRGDQFRPPRYRVIDRSILRQAIQAGDGPRDATRLVVDDPPFERSGLAHRKEPSVGEGAA